MNRHRILWTAATCMAVLVLHSQQAGNRAASAPKTITESDCTAAKLGSEIPASAIGEPVSGVTLSAPQWHAESGAAPAYCSIEGSIAPVDKNAPPIRFGVALPGSWASRGAQLGGGGMNGTIPRLTGGVGRGGSSLLQQGFATYGSDSGHQMGGFGMPPGGRAMPGGARGETPGQAQPGAAPGGPGFGGRMPGMAGRGQGMPAGFGAPNPEADKWALNDEAISQFRLHAT